MGGFGLVRFVAVDCGVWCCRWILGGCFCVLGAGGWRKACVARLGRVDCLVV